MALINCFKNVFGEIQNSEQRIHGSKKDKGEIRCLGGASELLKTLV